MSRHTSLGVSQSTSLILYQFDVKISDTSTLVFIPAGKPRCIATNCTQNGSDTYTLATKPPELKTHHKGRVCINANCTGSGTLHYKWFRKNSNGNFDPIDSVEFVDSACDSGVHIDSLVSSTVCV